MAPPRRTLFTSVDTAEGGETRWGAVGSLINGED
jgi:hypothetical protein